MATYQEAQYARKKALERYRYARRTHGIKEPHSKLKTQLRRVKKGDTSVNYDRDVDYFNSLNRYYFNDVVRKDYFEPDDETAPNEMSYREEYSARLHSIDNRIGDKFDSMITYIEDNTSMSGDEIEDILQDAGDYINEIEQIYQKYAEYIDSVIMGSIYNEAMRVLHDMKNELFHVFGGWGYADEESGIYG